MNTALKPITLAALVAVGLAGAAPRGQAQALAFSFDQNAVTLTPGQTVTFGGTVTNVSDIAPVIDTPEDIYIIGTQTDLFSSGGLTTPLLTTTQLLAPPEPLADEDSFSSDFFSLTADPMTVPDTYVGRYTITSQDLSGALYSDTQTFQVKVVAPVPDAPPLLCLGAGLLLLGGFSVRRRVAGF